MYDPLIRDCKVHVALGNHDIKGCRAVAEYERLESCVQDLRAAIVADLKARYMRQGWPRPRRPKRRRTETAAETRGSVGQGGTPPRKANCLPGRRDGLRGREPEGGHLQRDRTALGPMPSSASDR